ncbi:MAG: hypothetical protein ACREV1_06025 [Gammaproteobacteria bacterium]
MSEVDRLARLIDELELPAPIKDRECRLILAISRIRRNEDVGTVCADLRLQRRHVERLADEVCGRGLEAVLPLGDRITEGLLSRRRQGVAQMLLGTLAEKRFEDITAGIVGGKVLRIEDHRPSRSDTDYRLLNGNGNPICRLNIKFHGTLFRGSKQYVDLDPVDCFALATYKIHIALKRQELDRLPYVFLVLSVPDLNASDVGRFVPDDDIWMLAALGGKRIVEEAIVDRLRSPKHESLFRPIFARMPEGTFRVISAKKAYDLLKVKLFERVHALTLKSFTRRFRNAEVDMHLSLSTELTPVRAFLEMLIKESPQKFAVRLYTGDY